MRRVDIDVMGRDKMPVMKRTVISALAATAALGLTLSFIPATAATAATPTTNPQACRVMSGTTSVIGEPAPVCGLVWTEKGAPNVRLPQDKPEMVYGVIYRTSYGAAPTAIILRDGTRIPLKASEANKWRYESPNKVGQTIVRAQVLKPNLPSKEAVKTWPYVFISDDALVDNFTAQAFTGRFATNNKSKQVWTRINWSPKGKVGDDLTGAIANWDINIQDGKTCRQAVKDQYSSDMKKTVGGKNTRLAWVPNTYVGGQAYFTLTTAAGVKFVRNAPSLQKLTTATWDPFATGKWNFKAINSSTSFKRLDIVQISPRQSTVKCKL